MFGKRSWRTLGVALACLVGVLWFAQAQTPTASKREALKKQFNAGNYKDTYDGLSKLALDPNDDKLDVGADLDLAIACLNSLGRVDEIDDFRAQVITAHAKNWRLLQTAAHSFMTNQHDGFIVAGKFYRGNKRGGGRYVSTMLRDRGRALQLMQDAQAQTRDETDKEALSSFYLQWADLLLTGGSGHEPWRLQYLTDLKQLPDYDEGGSGRYYGGRRGRYYGGSGVPAPVDADGNPIFHTMPKGYDAAESDGQRWRWMLAQAVEMNPKRLNEVELSFANFQRQQFDVQTMATYGSWNDEASDKNEGTFSVHTLEDDETIARLANGIKRFKLPDEFNFLKIYERIAARGKSSQGEQARDMLATIYQDRRQYSKAAEAWKKAIAEYGVGVNSQRKNALEQIVNNWGRFEAIGGQPASTRATVDYRFRNGTKISLEAHAIKVEKLLADVKQYLENNPPLRNNEFWEKAQISNIGWRLVEKNQKEYLGDKVAAWDLELKPRPNHVDDRVTITTPLDKPGAYLVTAQMAGGNLSRVILWVGDTVIAKKQLDGKVYYFVADAVSGKPVEKAELDFFGWKQVPVDTKLNTWKIVTQNGSDKTDADGQVFVTNKDQPHDFQWLVTARKARDGDRGGDRFAFLGFTNVWYNTYYDPDYNATRVFTITDRPVYRPGQPIHFKFWVRHAKYDQPDTSDFANQQFTVQAHNPKGEKVYEKTLTADAYGGLSDEFTLPRDATLGQYSLQIVNHGGSHFRLEEYKKPEFEVIVEAPKEPVRLGEKITATIQAKYYFGAPVTKGKVKYKVLRTTYDSRWYPRGEWDWFYGRGYWWFTADYDWYPGFAEWGCKRPLWWWYQRAPEQPEVVMENEVPVGPDGKVEVTIDTLPAKELHGQRDHSYAITAEVVDESRRTIVGTGNVLVSRKPFQVYGWTNRGHYRAGDTVEASFTAQRLDQKPVAGKGELTLFKIGYEKDKPVEKAVETWQLDSNEQGQARQQIKAAEAGQYRLSYKVTDSKKHTIEGGYVFVVRGDNFKGDSYRFNNLELVTDKREYQPNEKVKMMLNVDHADGTVLLFVRPTNGIYLAPKVIRITGKSTVEELTVVQRDMPNFFVEALTIADGKVHTETREVIVPPEKRILNVAVLPSRSEYKPGEKATVKVKLTDAQQQPFVGSTVLSIYDKSVEYISGGSNVPEIKEYFWKWRRSHYPRTETSLGQQHAGNILRAGERGMGDLGVFGNNVVEELAFGARNKQMTGLGAELQSAGRGGALKDAAPGEGLRRNADLDELAKEPNGKNGAAPGPETPPNVEPTVRKNFADTAFWSASVTTDKDGTAEISLDMPENLTGWKVKCWAMGHGTKVGQGEVEVTTKKNLLVRLQAPRFFVQKDEVVLSANVHNYLKSDKDVTVALELEGKTLEIFGAPATQKIKVPAGGEQRVDWRVKVTNEGQATVRMKALTDEESDAMQMSFPCFVHGMLKTDSFSGVIRPDKESGTVTINVPAERRVNESILEVRYSPTLAGAMVDALPYMVDYPYGCTEQTLNRFLPTVITQRILLNMKLDLKDIQQKRTNLNAQEIGEASERAKQWKRLPRNPVFDEVEVKAMTKAGIDRLASMQCSDGGWGWFSGWGEYSYPHTTAVVVHGLQIAKQAGVVLPANMLERGVAWLTNYQQGEIQKIKNAPGKVQPWKEHADNLDALVFMILNDGNVDNADMRDFLYRDRNHLSVYAKAMFGIALHRTKQADKLAMILKNCEQYLVQDDENQTAYLRLPEGNYWWYWYGSDIEANAYYLKLLTLTNPKDERASRLVKYLLNNRKHSTYWNSTRDTAVCIEAMAEYLTASGEDRPDMTLEVLVDGKKHKEVKIDGSNLFSFDNRFLMVGDAVETGKHTIELKKKGTGPVYFNAYLTNFTLEDFITKAGLEVKVQRKYYKLTAVDKKIKVPGSRGQALDQKVEKFERTELQNLAALKSGDLVEVELEIDSKNDYEYILFEDPKAAGFEPMLVRSGYNPNDMGAYMELRDEKVCFFVRALARGKHSLSYRLRAEIPGKFSALPTRAAAMYAPELKGNSDEIKLIIND